jgi:uncharacterized protein YecE (DUF72 family)
LPRAAKAPEPIPAPPASAPNLYIGTSGWAYPTWKPEFYPSGVPARSFLRYYGSQLNAVEVNYTFRTLPSPTQLENWQASIPEGFRFSFKAPQRITHFARLRDSQSLVEAFLNALAPVRAGHLGPLLFQLPPNLQADRDLLARFLELPAFHHTHVQLAFEFRHQSWFSDEIYSVLREHNAALCVAESDDLSTPDVQTAPRRCYRLRRSGGYSIAELDTLAERFVDLAREGEIFIFLKHEDEPTGALNAAYLRQRAAELASAAARGSNAG